jgi:23S rRNA (cytosine1962-C5)-methyltransferase
MNEGHFVRLKAKKDASLIRKHPWVFSGAIKETSPGLQPGDLVEVIANKGRRLGWGHWSPGASIAVRMLTFGEADAPDADWWRLQIEQAVGMRRVLRLLEQPDQNSCRLIHAEGDGLPGLIADWYNGVVVLQTHSVGMARGLKWITEALQEVLGDSLQGIYNKSEKVLGKHGQTSPLPDGWLTGNLDVSTVVALEYGMAFEVDIVQGQKTGFFIDQRENRALLRNMSAGRKVLNVFSYTGGFSIAALKGGAELAASLDSSARALEVAALNATRNGYDDSMHKTIEADAVDFLKDGVGDYDVVVLDPPAFAKSASARHAAVQGYKRINQRTMQSMKPGSLLFTFSCSQAVDDRLFTNTVVAAAISAERNVRILHRLHQPPDHPVSAFHPEGAYLKGLVLRVD